MYAAESLHLLVGRPRQLEGIENSPLLVLRSHVGMDRDSGGAGPGEHGHTFVSTHEKSRLKFVQFPPGHSFELPANVPVPFKAVRPAADFGDIADAEAGDKGIERVSGKIQVGHPVQEFLLPALVFAIDFGIAGGIDDGHTADAARFRVGFLAVLVGREVL
jgi:hypothetical protein